MGLIMTTDLCIRELGMVGRMHVNSSLQSKGFFYRLSWPFIVFGLLLTVADIIFQVRAGREAPRTPGPRRRCQDRSLRNNRLAC